MREFEIFLCILLTICMLGMALCVVVIGIGITGDLLGYWDMNAEGNYKINVRKENGEWKFFERLPDDFVF